MNDVDAANSAKPFSQIENVTVSSIPLDLNDTATIPEVTTPFSILPENISNATTATPLITTTAPYLDMEYHEFYIYIWSLFILGCILFTTGR